jgi:hypothetical protein
MEGHLVLYVLWDWSGVASGYWHWRGVQSVYWHKHKWVEGGWVSILTEIKWLEWGWVTVLPQITVTGGEMGKYTVTNRNQMWGVGLVHVALDFHTTCIFIHYKFSPLICLSYAKSGHSVTADKHFELLHGSTVCQQRIVFNFLLTSSSKKVISCHQTVLLLIITISYQWLMKFKFHWPSLI